MQDLFEAKVLSVRHWTERQFSFTCTRDAGFRFQSGQFAMIGLRVDGKPLLRAYSMVSPHYEPTLEFLSIKVPTGALTSRLQRIQPGHTVLVGRKAFGTLLAQNLLPGRRLFLLSTGTGLAPFMSIVRDPEIYEQFEQVVLVHGCRRVAELAYDQLLQHDLPRDPWFGSQVARQLVYYPAVTQEPFIHQGRIPALLASGRLCDDIVQPALNRAHDRFMLCGSPQMLRDTRAVLDGLGCAEGRMSQAGHYLVERAFVDK